MIRSRLAASVVAFLIGFAVSNVGLLMVPRPDTWLWLAAGIVMMLTGVVGVLFADTRRNLSIWSLLGVEVFVCFTLAPLLWVFRSATAAPGVRPNTLWPSEIDWSAFSEVWSDGVVRTSMGTTLVVAGLATVIAVALALPAAYVMVRRSRGRWWYLLFLVAFLMPVFVLAAPATAQLQAFGLSTSRLAMAVPTLAVTLPIAVWVSVRVVRRAPWSLHDALQVDGASMLQRIRHFFVPYLAVDVLLLGIIVFFWAAGDYALGAGMAPTQDQRPLSATLLTLDDSRLVAAAGLWVLLPLLVLTTVFSRRVVSLVGRS